MIVLLARMVKHLGGESQKLTVTIKHKPVSDPMTIINDGPFITLSEVFTA